MPLWEFVCMVASMMALNAFAIDIMLPAMGVIADYYHVEGNQQQWLLYSYMIGFGVPQLFFGPITDRFGRKTLLRICISLHGDNLLYALTHRSFSTRYFCFWYTRDCCFHRP